MIYNIVFKTSGTVFYCSRVYPLPKRAIQKNASRRDAFGISSFMGCSQRKPKGDVWADRVKDKGWIRGDRRNRRLRALGLKSARAKEGPCDQLLLHRFPEDNRARCVLRGVGGVDGNSIYAIPARGSKASKRALADFVEKEIAIVERGCCVFFTRFVPSASRLVRRQGHRFYCRGLCLRGYSSMNLWALSSMRGL
jgi:hypothetical protein